MVGTGSRAFLHLSRRASFSELHARRLTRAHFIFDHFASSVNALIYELRGVVVVVHRGDHDFSPEYLLHCNSGAVVLFYFVEKKHPY